jgi:hypothetical protein
MPIIKDEVSLLFSSWFSTLTHISSYLALLPPLSSPLIHFLPCSKNQEYGLIAQHPGLRKNQYEDLLYKKFQKAPENRMSSFPVPLCNCLIVSPFLITHTHSPSGLANSRTSCSHSLSLVGLTSSIQPSSSRIQCFER